MLLVIFGAGASYDSVPDLVPYAPPLPALRPQAYAHEDDRPPLASQLFDNRKRFVAAMARFPDCIPLIAPLRKPGVVVEQELAKFQMQAKAFPHVYRELASIRYYLHFAIWECQRHWRGQHSGITNYATLLGEIERWRYEFEERVCFVTFNYDTMPEDAMQQVLDFQIANMNSYVSHGNYILIKLHGSINWGRALDGITNPESYSLQRLITEAANLQVSNRYQLVADHPMLREAGTLVFPAIAIPVEKKDEFVCPVAHLEALERALPNVTKIATIGWRATEADFIGMLRSKLNGKADLLVVSGDAAGAAETFKNLAVAQCRSHSYRERLHRVNKWIGIIRDILTSLDLEHICRGFRCHALIASACVCFTPLSGPTAGQHIE